MTQRALIISCWLLRVVFSFFFFFLFPLPPFLNKAKVLLFHLAKEMWKTGPGLGWVGLVTDRMSRLPRKAGRWFGPWIFDAGLCVHIIQGRSSLAVACEKQHRARHPGNTREMLACTVSLFLLHCTLSSAGLHIWGGMGSHQGVAIHR